MHGRHDVVAACCRGSMAVALLLPAGAEAQAPATADAPPPAVSLGAHTLLTQSEGFGTNPAISAPITTQPSDSALIVFNGGYAGNAGPPVDSHANRWRQLGHAVTYGNGYDGFNVSAYIALPARGGPGHTVSMAKGANAAGEISVPFVEIRHAGKLQDVAQNYPAAGLVLTSGSVTTTGPATLVAFWWGDGAVTRMTARPNNGFTVIDRYLMLPDNSGVQCAVAFRQVSAAGTYNVSWIGAPMQGAILWLLAFQQ